MIKTINALLRKENFRKEQQINENDNSFENSKQHRSIRTTTDNNSNLISVSQYIIDEIGRIISIENNLRYVVGLLPNI